MTTIKCVPDGPYAVASEEGKPDARLRRASGEEIALPAKASLCRCGGSKKKPFCDGTHRTNGFKSAGADAPAKAERKSYAGKRITILDDRSICSHAAHCTDELGKVFRLGGEPWIDPTGAGIEKIVETVRKCPSGALSCAVDGVEAAPPQRPPQISVTDNGPLAITGGIELAGVDFAEGASREHYTLCRCGASKNKPFCDGSHWQVKFRDP